MTFVERLDRGPFLMDGAFGTYCSRRQGFRGGQYELLNLTDPKLVEDIHREYLAAGCNAIKTNTFAANRETLGDKLEGVISAACTIAKAAAAGTDARIFADLGPLPGDPEHFWAFKAFREIIDLFLENGLTHFLFETLDGPAGLQQAAAYIKGLCPQATVIASFAVSPDGFTRSGLSGRELVVELQEDEALDAIGFNCVSGPHHLLQLIRTLPPLKKHLYVCPNEGYPTLEGGLARFGDNPGYFAHVLMEILDAGADIIGGCCGTTPTHIREIAKLLEERAKRPPVPVNRPGVKPSALPPISSPLWEKLERGELVIAAELDPPAVSDIRKFLKNAENLVLAGADTITVADCPVARVKADSSMMAAKLKRELGLDPLPHMTCRDRNLNAARALLLGLSIEEIHNVLVVTGDPVQDADRGEVKGVWSYSSSGLASYVQALSQEGMAAPFHIWGALNVNAVNFDAELQKAFRKMDCGVGAFLTQPVFTPQSMENLRRARKALEGAYLLGGILPVISHRSAVYMNNEVAGIVIPQEVVDRYENADKEQCRRLAIEHSLALAREIRDTVDGFYVITPGARPGIGVDVVKALRELK